jgi:flagellar basal-body rod protein FlgB
MPFDLDAAFGIHQQSVVLRSRRAEVLAANLANADTPGYKARDIDFASTLKAAAGNQSGAELKTTNSRHITSSGDAAAGANMAAELKYRQATQPSVDGNTVDAQVEKAEFARNAVQYQASLDFLSGRIRKLLTAIRGE